MDLSGKYVARVNFVIGGKRHAPGSELHLSHDEAERAIAQGTVEVEKPKGGPVQRPRSDLERQIERQRSDLYELGERVDRGEARVAELTANLAEQSAGRVAAEARVAELEELLAQATAPAQTTLLAEGGGDAAPQGDPKTTSTGKGTQGKRNA